MPSATATTDALMGGGKAALGVKAVVDSSVAGDLSIAVVPLASEPRGNLRTAHRVLVASHIRTGLAHLRRAYGRALSGLLLGREFAAPTGFANALSPEFVLRGVFGSGHLHSVTLRSDGGL
jgi:hypothetical protein